MSATSTDNLSSPSVAAPPGQQVAVEIVPPSPVAEAIPDGADNAAKAIGRKSAIVLHQEPTTSADAIDPATKLRLNMGPPSSCKKRVMPWLQQLQHPDAFNNFDSPASTRTVVTPRLYRNRSASSSESSFASSLKLLDENIVLSSARNSLQQKLDLAQDANVRLRDEAAGLKRDAATKDKLIVELKQNIDRRDQEILGLQQDEELKRQKIGELDLQVLELSAALKSHEELEQASGLDKATLKEHITLLTKRLEELSSEQGLQMGHQNPNQKIKYLQKLKADHALMAEKNDELTAQLATLLQQRKTPPKLEAPPNNSAPPAVENGAAATAAPSAVLGASKTMQRSVSAARVPPAAAYLRRKPEAAVLLQPGENAAPTTSDRSRSLKRSTAATLRASSACLTSKPGQSVATRCKK